MLIHRVLSAPQYFLQMWLVIQWYRGFLDYNSVPVSVLSFTNVCSIQSVMANLNLLKSFLQSRYNWNIFVIYERKEGSIKQSYKSLANRFWVQWEGTVLYMQFLIVSVKKNHLLNRNCFPQNESSRLNRYFQWLKSMQKKLQNEISFHELDFPNNFMLKILVVVLFLFISLVIFYVLL